MRNYFSEMRMINDKFPLSIGEEMVRNERALLSKVENGKMMMSADSVRFLVLHCSATRRNQDYSVEQLRRDHKSRGFYDTCLATTPKECPCLDAHDVFGWIEEL